MIQDIPVVILCGGKGTRLKEETEFRPKPLVPVGGRPILWHILKIYRHWGYRHFILTLGYKGDKIKEYFLLRKWLESDFRLDVQSDDKVVLEDHNGDDFQILFADTGEDTLTAERIALVGKYIQEPRFMVTYGDGVADINIPALVDFHVKQGTMGTITGVHPSSKYGLVNVDAAHRVTSFEQKPRLHDYVNGGFMVFERAFLDCLRAGTMIEETMADLVKEQQLSLYQHEGFWHCMDTYKDYEDLNALWSKDPRWKIWS